MSAVYPHDCAYCHYITTVTINSQTYDMYICVSQSSGQEPICLAKYGRHTYEYESLSALPEKWDEALKAFLAGECRPSMGHPWSDVLLHCWHEGANYYRNLLCK